MRKWLIPCLVLIVNATGQAEPRYLEGVGIPNTETLGGESITGTIDWGNPPLVTTADYDISIGGESFSGEFALAATTISGPSAQLVYVDPANGLVLSAVSADGPTSLDAELYSLDGGYGGYETWLLTDTAPLANRYGTITSIVPEPGWLGMLCWIVAMFALRTHRR